MHCDAATAAADPPEDPPGTRSGSQGLHVTCGTALLELANTSVNPLRCFLAAET